MTEKIKPISISHEQYEKLVDDVYFLGNAVVLRMNVVLAKKSDDGRRFYYHNEFLYSTNKYIDTNQIVTMRRSFDYFLTIENNKYIDGEKESLMIRIQDMLILRQLLSNVYAWFTSQQYRNLFAFSKGKLILLDKVDPIVISGLALGKYLSFEPTIVSYDNAEYEGVRMYLNSKSNYVDMTVDRFMGFYYLISTIDLYQSAQLLLNYHGRPEMGTHVTTFNDEATMEESGFVEIKQTRQLPNKQRQKSFFDKVDEL